MAGGHDLGLVSRVYEVFERFEPVISVSLDLGQPVGHRRLLAQQFLLPPQIFLARHGPVEVRIEKAVEPGLDGREPRLLRAGETGRGLGRLGSPLRDLPPHLLGPSLGQRDLLHRLPHLSGQGLLADIGLAARPELLGAAVIVMALLPLGGNGAAALPATQQPQEREGFPALAVHLPPARHHFLYPLKQVAGNQRLVRALVQLALEIKLPDIERVHEQPLDAPKGERFSFAAHQAEGRDLAADLLEREPAGRVGLEHPAHERRGLRVHDDGAQPGFVPVPDRRLARKLPAPQFLPDAAPDVLAQVVHVILGLPERDVEHEFPLRRVLEPEGRELERGELAGVEQIDDSPAVHRVAREPVRVPREYARRLAALDPRHHRVEHRPARHLGGLGLDELRRHGEGFLAGMLAQLGKLRLNRKHLTLLVVGGLAGVEKEIHAYLLLVFGQTSQAGRGLLESFFKTS